MTTRFFLALASLAITACAARATHDGRGAAAPPAPPAAASAAPAVSPAAPTAQGPRHGCLQNFAAFDADSDTQVSREEFRARPHALPDPDGAFATRDADGDGRLTTAEFCAGWGAAGGPRVSGATGSGGPGMGRPRRPRMGTGPAGSASEIGMAGGHERHCEVHFASFDANADGNVTELEFAALPHPRADAHEVFQARDDDHDGLLTKAEFCSPWSRPSPPGPPPSP